MKRNNDWPEKLAEVVAERSASSVEYPCAYFAADCVLAMTGEDPLPERLSADEQYARMRRDGFATLRDAVGARLREVPIAHARRGDLVIALVDGADALGVCLGERSAFVGKDGGVGYLNTLEMAAAFSVPFED